MADDLEQWLRNIGLGDYVEGFAAQRVTWDVLGDLSDQDLKELGLPLGDRKRFLRAITTLEERAAAPASMESFSSAVSQGREAQRRQLTVLFCDLVGSTELSRRLDPEDLRDLSRRYQDGVAGVIARYGGYVANFLGDGIVAYFGWPLADEDQAEQAVRAGLEALAAVRSLSDGRGDGLSVLARVGIASGVVVVGDLESGGARQAAVSGETPNLAARLQAEALPDQVVIGGLTRQLVGDVFELDDFGARSLKGFATPVPTWRVVRERTIESRFAARRGQHTPFIGREQEVALLLERWKRAVVGEGQVVLLAGEAGIGKSRVALTLRSRLAEVPHTWISFQCSPFHAASALYPAIRHLERASGFGLEDTPESRYDKLEALLREASEDISESTPLLADLLLIPSSQRYELPDMPADVRKRRTLKALSDQLLGLATKKPVLFVLEDAHWIDPTTRELIDELLVRIADSRVMVLVTHRPEFNSEWSRHPHATVLTLNRLSRAHGAEVVRAASAEVLNEQVVARILRRCDGVPLFIEELTRSVLESGGRLNENEVPETLQGALQARLDRLEPDARELAQIGATIGREFQHELLALIAKRPLQKLIPLLDRLVEARIILPAGGERTGSYAFRHALIQDAAYNSLLLSRRRAYHSAIGAALESEFSDIARAQPELVAQHFTAADLPDRAVAHWLRAARSAGERSAHAEAISLLTSALAVIKSLPIDAATRIEAEIESHLALGHAQIRLNLLGEARASFSAAAEIAKANDRPADFFKAAIGFEGAELYSNMPQQESVEMLRAVLATLPDGDRINRCCALSRLGRALFSIGKATEAAEAIQQSITLARQIGDPLALFEARVCELPLMAGHPWSAAQFHERRSALDEMLASAEATRQPSHKMLSLSQRFGPLLELGDIAGFNSGLDKYAAVAEENQSLADLWTLGCGRVVQALLTGEIAAAERGAEASLHLGETAKIDAAAGVYGVQMFTIRREQGRLAEVAPALKRFIDDNPSDTAWRPGLALVACDLGFDAPARNILREIAHAGFAIPVDAKRTLTLSYLAEVCARLDDGDSAKQVYDLMLPYQDMAVMAPLATMCCGAAARYLGMLAGVLADWKAADAHFERALAFDESLQAWLWHARTRYEYALVLLKRNRKHDRDRATELLASAGATAERFGMTALRQQIETCCKNR
jgi:class 3 adenylate cyclase/tetratricopeptide (TPR) repeat protein